MNDPPLSPAFDATHGNPYASPQSAETSTAVDVVSQAAEPPPLPERGILATHWGRLTAFFCLYLTEGLPLGFTSVVLVAQMKRADLTDQQTSTFVALLYLPWGWKLLAGPFVDNVYLARIGHRRGWIVGCQIMMIVTLAATVAIDFRVRSGYLLLVGVILVHNVFAATMDVAIDALAINTLREEERGMANGLMFAAAYLGNGLGGAVVLQVIDRVGLTGGTLLNAGAILAVLLGVSLWLRETATPVKAPHLAAELGRYAFSTIHSLFYSRRALAGLGFAVLPAGAYALGLALQTNLSVKLGMTDAALGQLSGASTIVAALGCVAGGWLSDRLGRQLSLGLYVVMTGIPTLLLAWWLSQSGLPPAGTPAAAPLMTKFWLACLIYSAAQGLMHGARTAMYMDLVNPTVAATQFTAYMALMNLAISYSAYWQGIVADRWGYPVVLVVDAALGCLCLLPLVLTRGKQAA